MKKLLLLLLLLIAPAGASNSSFVCTAPDGREVWVERFYGFAKPTTIVWAIDWEGYPNHKERLALTDKPINLGIFCKQ